jgi:hypothetical protein
MPQQTTNITEIREELVFERAPKASPLFIFHHHTSE